MEARTFRNCIGLIRKHVAALAFTVLIASTSALAQEKSPGHIVSEIFHARTLENTVTKESPDRHISIYLPPGYDQSPSKRYPVVFLLHGIADTDETWTRPWTKNDDGYATIRDLMNRGIEEGKFGEMIIVMPDEKTKAFGSFYVNSSVTGNWEDFTVKELVAHIDEKYRTLPRSESRGLAGHSMGGYGAITLAMKDPGIFSVIYAMNPAVMGWAGDFTMNAPAFTNIIKINSNEDLQKTGDLYTMAMVTLGEAFSPNAGKPPFFMDLPFAMVDGKVQPAAPAYAKWEENFPVNMVKGHLPALKQLRGLRFDSGSDDEFKFIPINARLLSAEFTKYGVDHTFEEYNGDHRNRLWSRKGRLYNDVLPYFWLLLDHERSGN